MKLINGESAPLLADRSMVRFDSEHHFDGVTSRVQAPPTRRKPLKWWIARLFQKKYFDTKRRLLVVGNVMRFDTSFFPNNEVNNRRFSLLSFIPMSLLNQFRYSFFNIYFLLVALSQLVPPLQVGFVFTYIAPLAFVVGLSVAKDGIDDLKRYIQDRKINGERYDQILPRGRIVRTAASAIKVGMLLRIRPHQRIPADLVLLHTSESNGACFVRTDQLDGETDWKLRHPAKVTRDLSLEELSMLRATVDCECPSKEIYKFEGRLVAEGHLAEGLALANTLLCSCTVPCGTVVGVVIYTGHDTRAQMNREDSRTKMSMVENELNRISVLCFVLLMILSVALTVQQQIVATTGILSALINVSRFQILMSVIVPISMRVNLDMARFWYSLVIVKDAIEMPGIVVRNTNIPEELGRLRYLFSDKTGTLTRNVMEFRTMHLDEGFSFEHTEALDVRAALRSVFSPVGENQGIVGFSMVQSQTVARAVKMLALCHNVTPVRNTEPPEPPTAGDSALQETSVATQDGLSTVNRSHATRTEHNRSDSLEYQAASPDEVAMVKFAARVGVHLSDRSVSCTGSTEGEMTLDTDFGRTLRFDILISFPFSSERKCMGIIVRCKDTGQITYLMKGADTKMITVVRRTAWLEERCSDMARSGRRTLVFAQRDLTNSEFEDLQRRLNSAHATPGLSARERAVASVMASLEREMTLVCATGVEDQLQDRVIQTLERLSACGIKVWMLTGDKVETAHCIGRSTKLIPTNCWETELLCTSEEETARQLEELDQQFPEGCEETWSLLLDGKTLEFALSDEVVKLFVAVAKRASSVIIARCSPTQKARVVTAVVGQCEKSVRAAAIGDGGNDVSMILAAHVGLGIEGVEGKQASMAADFSITQFSHCERLVTWHGRNSYKRTCVLTQFIMHRGLIYAICQAVFSMTFSGSTMAVFNSYLLMFYPTLLTSMPAFAIVLDEDQLESSIGLFPELYKDLLKSRSLNFCSFLQWVWFSFFQGGLMMILALKLFQTQLFQLVNIAFTVLLLTELLVIASCVHIRILWRQRRAHLLLFLGTEAISVLLFWLSVFFLPDTFDVAYVLSMDFLRGVGIIAAASICPMIVLGALAHYISRAAVTWGTNYYS